MFLFKLFHGAVSSRDDRHCKLEFTELGKTLLLISCTGVFSNGVIMSQRKLICDYRSPGFHVKQLKFFFIQAVPWSSEFKRRSALQTGVYRVRSVLKLNPRRVDGVFQSNSSDSCDQCPGTGATLSHPAKTLLLFSMVVFQMAS